MAKEDAVGPGDRLLSKLDRLRAADPVHRSEVFQAWILSRHADVWDVFRDARFSLGSFGTPPADPAAPGTEPLYKLRANMYQFDIRSRRYATLR